MPVPPKMHILDAEVGRHQNSCPRGTRSTAQSSPIPVATAGPPPRAAPYPLNQLLFADWHRAQYIACWNQLAGYSSRPTRLTQSLLPRILHAVEPVTVVIRPFGHLNYAALVTIQRGVPRLTAGIRFATFNSPLTHTCRTKCRNMNQLREFGFRPAWFHSFTPSHLHLKSWWNQDSEPGHDRSRSGRRPKKIYFRK